MNRSISEIFSVYCFQKKDITPIRKLDSGDYGYSYVANHRTTNRNIVVKQIYFDRMEPQRQKTLYASYVLLMRALSRYINPPIGFIFLNPIHVATEEKKIGSLFDAIKRNELDGTKKTKIALGIAYGMRRLHKMHLVHGDLKSKNVLLEEDFTPLISDFSLGVIASDIQAPIQYKISDPYWCAPEVLKGERTTVKSDVYTFGALIAEMFSERQLFQGIGYFARANDDLIPPTAPKMIQALVRVCTSKDPGRRPNFRRIYRLFKRGICFFEGTDHEVIRREVMMIREERNKAKARFAPLVSVEIPNRTKIVELIKISEELTGKKQAKKTIMKNSMSIGVREARSIPLSKVPMSTGVTIKTVQSETQKIENQKALENGGNSVTTVAIEKLSMGKMSLKPMGISTHRPANNNNIREGGKSLVPSPPPVGSKPSRGVPLGLRTASKGRISLADRFKTMDDVDGKNYLRLPRRIRKIYRVPSDINFFTKDQIYRSYQSIPKIKEDTTKCMTRSLLSLDALLKQGRISLPYFKKTLAPTELPLSKQIIPFIRPRTCSNT